jgi:hypothetical protein
MRIWEAQKHTDPDPDPQQWFFYIFLEDSGDVAKNTVTVPCVYRHPRSCLLNFTADFLSKCSAKLAEINKKSAQVFNHKIK